jgi:hypothetical protein
LYQYSSAGRSVMCRIFFSAARLLLTRRALLQVRLHYFLGYIPGNYWYPAQYLAALY